MCSRTARQFQRLEIWARLSLPRDQETLHLIGHLLAHYPGDGKTTGIEPRGLT